MLQFYRRFTGDISEELTMTKSILVSLLSSLSLYFRRFGRASDSSSPRDSLPSDERIYRCGCVSGRLDAPLLTMLGQIIVTLTSAGSGTEAPLKVSMW
jgi:hypothetical protein